MFACSRPNTNNKTSPVATPAIATMKFLVSIGSYERVIYGLDVELTVPADSDSQATVQARVGFAIPAHTGYVKCIASCPRFLVSGGTDEVIRIFDLRKRKDIGSINQHDGSIRSLHFYSSTHLMSAAEDGKLALFRTRDWECLHLFQKHKKPIKDMQIHPSGKLAVALDEDKNLTLWNLVTGKMAHTSKIPALGQLDRIVWSGSGSHYALLGETHLLVFEAQTSRKVVDLKASTLTGRVRAEKWLTAAFVHDDALLFAGETGRLHMIKLDAPTERLVIDTGHKPRIRAIAFYSPPDGTDLLVTGGSDGVIKIFDWAAVSRAMVPMTQPSQPSQLPSVPALFEHRTDLRITCMTVTTQE